MTNISVIKILIIFFLLILIHIVYMIGFREAEPYLDHLYLLLAVEICVESILLIITFFLSYNIYFRYKKPRWFWNFIENFDKHLIKKRFDKIFEEDKTKKYQEQLKEYHTGLIENAIKNVNSTDIGRKMAGIEQLYNLGENGILQQLKIYIKSY